MVETPNEAREIANQLKEAQTDIVELMSVMETYLAITGQTRSVSAVESAYYHVADALNDINEFAEYVEGESL